MDFRVTSEIPDMTTIHLIPIVSFALILIAVYMLFFRSSEATTSGPPEGPKNLARAGSSDDWAASRR